MGDTRSVQPEWCLELPIQQQAVLFLAARGPDGIPKHHPCKGVQRAYRATVFVAARLGRMMTFDDEGDTFMSLEQFRDGEAWAEIVKEFFASIDQLPLHFVMHLMHGAQILGYKHPEPVFRNRWLRFYTRCVNEFHLHAENEFQMNLRLNDWGREDWD